MKMEAKLKLTQITLAAWLASVSLTATAGEVTLTCHSDEGLEVAALQVKVHNSLLNEGRLASELANSEGQVKRKYVPKILSGQMLDVEPGLEDAIKVNALNYPQCEVGIYSAGIASGLPVDADFRLNYVEPDVWEDFGGDYLGIRVENFLSSELLPSGEEHKFKLNKSQLLVGIIDSYSDSDGNPITVSCQITE